MPPSPVSIRRVSAVEQYHLERRRRFIVCRTCLCVKDWCVSPIGRPAGVGMKACCMHMAGNAGDDLFQSNGRASAKEENIYICVAGDVDLVKFRIKI